MMNRIKLIPLEAGEILNGVVYYTNGVATHRVAFQQLKGMPKEPLENDNSWEAVPIVFKETQNPESNT